MSSDDNWKDAVTACRQQLAEIFDDLARARRTPEYREIGIRGLSTLSLMVEHDGAKSSTEYGAQVAAMVRRLLPEERPECHGPFVTVLVAAWTCCELLASSVAAKRKDAERAVLVLDFVVQLAAAETQRATAARPDQCPSCDSPHARAGAQQGRRFECFDCGLAG